MSGAETEEGGAESVRIAGTLLASFYQLWKAGDSLELESAGKDRPGFQGDSGCSQLPSSLHGTGAARSAP